MTVRVQENQPRQQPERKVAAATTQQRQQNEGGVTQGKGVRGGTPHLVATWCVYGRVWSPVCTRARPKSPSFSSPVADSSRLLGFRSCSSGDGGAGDRAAAGFVAGGLAQYCVDTHGAHCSSAVPDE